MSLNNPSVELPKLQVLLIGACSDLKISVVPGMADFLTHDSASSFSFRGRGESATGTSLGTEPSAGDPLTSRPSGRMLSQKYRTSSCASCGDDAGCPLRFC